ncbi:hypothetical protein VNO77_02882 [Canavalia gladiata]|uniref:Uncharacterized protein n=1 Tax=Canavalia gladiata TaxID=3824 RepID=A0AAN9MTR6_CANGL
MEEEETFMILLGILGDESQNYTRSRYSLAKPPVMQGLFRLVVRKHETDMMAELERKASMATPESSILFKESMLEATPLQCIDVGALLDFDGIITFGFVLVVDQLLLMVSIFLTYLDGVIPVEKSYPN